MNTLHQSPDRSVSKRKRPVRPSMEESRRALPSRITLRPSDGLIKSSFFLLSSWRYMSLFYDSFHSFFCVCFCEARRRKKFWMTWGKKILGNVPLPHTPRVLPLKIERKIPQMGLPVCMNVFVFVCG